MAEANTDQQIDTHYQEWWDETIHYKIKDKWRPAVQEYFDYHAIPLTHERFSLKFVKRVIPGVGIHDDKWKRFPKNSFNPDKFKAHQAMFTMVEDEFKKLSDEAE